MKVKNVFCKAAAKLVKKAAINASNAASFMAYHQPKEPEALRKMKR